MKKSIKMEQNENYEKELFEELGDLSTSSSEFNEKCTTSHPNDPTLCQMDQLFANPKENPMIKRLMRDLQSPSAASRVRAQKALKSETKRNNYTKFDVPHEEQDILTEEERKSPVIHKSIQEVMKNVSVYVEVRTGEDNRTQGIQKVISLLGAHVHDRIYKNTTHVIFKDGLCSAYFKAKCMKIPIVSILWIEACKRNMKIVEPKLYPITNIERYENPELYKKIKRQKSMQPGAVDKIRLVKKGTKGSNKNTPTNKQCGQALPKFKLNKKQDGVEKMIAEFQNNLMSTPDAEMNSRPLELLKMIRNSPTTTKRVLSEKQLIEKLTRINSVSEFSSNDSNASEILNTPLQNVRKQVVNDKGYSTDPFARSRRKTVIRAKVGPVCTVTSGQQSTPTTFRRLTRRSSMLMQQQQQVSSISGGSADENVRTVTKIASQLSMDDFVEKTPTKAKTPFNRRRTMFTPRPAERIVEEIMLTPTQKNNVIKQKNGMEGIAVTTEIEAQRKLVKAVTISEKVAIKALSSLASDPMELGKNVPPKTRKTVYSPQAMDESSKEDALSGANITNKSVLQPTPNNNLRRRTLYTPQPMEQTICYSESDYTPIINGKNRSNRISFALPQNNEKNDKENSPIKMRRQRTALYSAVEVQETSPISSTLSNNSILTPPRQALLVEEEATSAFNSARMPNKNNRKSIIDMRIDHINTKNRRLTMSATANESVVEKVVDVLTSVANSSLFDENSNMPSNIKQSNIDSFYKQQKKSHHKQTKPGWSLISSSTDSDFAVQNLKIAEVTKPAPKKRKLFALSKSHSDEDLTDTHVVAKKTPANSRRRTIAAVKPNSDDDFVDEKNTNAYNKQGSNQISQKETQGNRRNSLAPRYVNTLVTPGTPGFRLKRVPNLACTNANKQQVDYIKQVINKLGGYSLKDEINDNTTVLVAINNIRTLKMVKAINRGIWIVSYDWVVKSDADSSWANQEMYELRTISKAVQESRSQRQSANSSKYRANIFENTSGKFYVSTTCYAHKELKNLILESAGDLTDFKGSAKFIITEVYPKRKIKEDAMTIRPIWIRDCIVENIFKNPEDRNYVIKP